MMTAMIIVLYIMRAYNHLEGPLGCYCCGCFQINVHLSGFDRCSACEWILYGWVVMRRWWSLNMPQILLLANVRGGRGGAGGGPQGQLASQPARQQNNNRMIKGIVRSINTGNQIVYKQARDQKAAFELQQKWNMWIVRSQHTINAIIISTMDMGRSSRSSWLFKLINKFERNNAYHFSATISISSPLSLEDSWDPLLCVSPSKQLLFETCWG